MGMYDTVKFKMTCPVCGTLCDNFQTKDLDCTLDGYEPLTDGIDEFCSSCENCDAFITVYREKDRYNSHKFSVIVDIPSPSDRNRTPGEELKSGVRKEFIDAYKEEMESQNDNP